jgi:hypothetical protein
MKIPGKTHCDIKFNIAVRCTFKTPSGLSITSLTYPRNLGVLTNMLRLNFDFKPKGSNGSVFTYTFLEI